MLVGTILLVVLSLLVVAVMVWFPPPANVPVDDSMEEDKENLHLVYVLKAVISGEALVYLVVNSRLLYRWVSAILKNKSSKPSNNVFPAHSWEA